MSAEMCPAESDFQMDAGRYQTETATHTVKPSNKQFHQQADDGQCVHLSAIGNGTNRDIRKQHTQNNNTLAIE
jgi:hypothetical protein